MSCEDVARVVAKWKWMVNEADNPNKSVSQIRMEADKKFGRH